MWLGGKDVVAMPGLPGNRKGKKLSIRLLPLSTVRKLILSSIDEDIQLSQEALQTATNYWEGEIKNWSQDLLRELEEASDNPNKTKGKGYRYRRITGLMTMRAIERYRRRE